jgi:hypothetical protein
VANVSSRCYRVQYPTAGDRFGREARADRQAQKRPWRAVGARWGRRLSGPRTLRSREACALSGPRSGHPERPPGGPARRASGGPATQAVAWIGLAPRATGHPRDCTRQAPTRTFVHSRFDGVCGVARATSSPELQPDTTKKSGFCCASFASEPRRPRSSLSSWESGCFR